MPGSSTESPFPFNPYLFSFPRLMCPSAVPCIRPAAITSCPANAASRFQRCLCKAKMFVARRHRRVQAPSQLFIVVVFREIELVEAGM